MVVETVERIEARKIMLVTFGHTFDRGSGKPKFALLDIWFHIWYHGTKNAENLSEQN
jgi:hypothetical protein